MSERVELEALLREAMTAAAPPALTPAFDRRVTERLRPRRLSPEARRTLRLYAALAGTASVAVMRLLGVHWSLVAASLLLTGAIAVILRAGLRVRLR